MSYFIPLLSSKALEEKLAHATKRESELQAKIAHLEDSTSTHSLDEVNRFIALISLYSTAVISNLHS